MSRLEQQLHLLALGLLSLTCTACSSLAPESAVFWPNAVLLLLLLPPDFATTTQRPPAWPPLCQALTLAISPPALLWTAGSNTCRARLRHDKSTCSVTYCRPVH